MSKRIAGALIIALALLAGACSGSDDESVSTDDSSASASEAASDDSGDDAADDGDADAGDDGDADAGDDGDADAGGDDDADGATDESSDARVVAAMTGDIDNFDPHTNQLILFQYSVKENVFETLVGYDDELGIVGELAETWEINDDATEFTFSLVEGATFHDGSPVDAEAIVANLQRIGEQDSVWATRVSLIEEYETPDDSTVIIRLSQPSAPFLDGLTGLSIISPASFETAVQEPVGSGPFTFVEWAPNEHILLERNDDYRDGPVGFAELELRPIPDLQVAYTNLQAGEVDIIYAADSALVAQVEATGDGEVVRPAFSNSVTLIEMTGIEDVNVRRALASAMDREAINDVAYGGDGVVADSPLPSGNWAYCATVDYPYDLDAAAEHLAEASDAPSEIQLEVLAGRAQAEQLARIWQQDLAEIGIDLTVNVSELSVWLDYYVNLDYDITWNTFNQVGDPNPYWEIVVGERRMTDEELEFFGAAAGTSDEEVRAENYCELQRLAMENLEILPVLFNPLYSVVATDRIDGYRLLPNGWGIVTDVTKN